MSSNSPNYMDGVPLKITEKLEPPPEVIIPEDALNRFNTLPEGHFNSPQYTYDFQLENQVIRKLAEWQKVRETERDARRERIRLNELKKQRELEERQKQLLTAVSYPSAEDLSSSDDEEEVVKEEVKEELAPPVDHHTRQSFDTILQPIVANSYSAHSPSTVFSPSKINYSDFENDTSSPFDNIELKTINDLDILAQILNDTQRHSVENDPEPAKQQQEQAEVEEEKAHPLVDEKPSSEQPIVNNTEPAAADVQVSTTSSSQNETANYYYTTNVIPNNYQMMVQQTQALHLQQQYMLNYANMNHQNHTGMVEPSMADVYFNYNNLPATGTPTVSNHNYLYRDYSQKATVAPSYNYSNGAFSNNYCDSQYGGAQEVDVLGAGGTGLQAELIPKSKSKSVPDILKELKDEIRDSEIRRTRNHSQTIDDQKKRNSADSAQSMSSTTATSRSSSSSSTSFMKLSPSSQNLAKNISSMGFPLERVAKIAELYGNDDKKIVEHLIPLSELLDLGFDETKISEALVKFDNNKDKALDFLIS